MSSPNYTIRPFAPSDISATGELLYNPKLALAINRLLFKNWPNEAIQRQKYTSTLGNLDPSTMESLTVIDNASGEVLAHLTITRNDATKTDVTSASGSGAQDQGTPPEVPVFSNPDVLTAVQAASIEINGPMKDTDHFELTHILVKPEHRGRGIGQTLMDHVFSKARALGLPVALAAEPQVYGYLGIQGYQTC